MAVVFGSTQRHDSAWPSAKDNTVPLLCRVAGKLIHVHFEVPNSVHLPAFEPKALC